MLFEIGDFDEVVGVWIIIFGDEYRLAFFTKDIQECPEHQEREIFVVVSLLGGLIRRVKVENIIVLEVDVEHTGDLELQGSANCVTGAFHLVFHHLDSLEILDLFYVSQILELRGSVWNFCCIQHIDEIPQGFSALELGGQRHDLLHQVLAV